MEYAVLKFPITIHFEEHDFSVSFDKPSEHEAFDVQVSQLVHQYGLLGGYNAESNYPDSKGSFFPFGEMRFGLGDCEQTAEGIYEQEFYVIGPLVPNPKHDRVIVGQLDFFDRARELDEALDAFLQEIRGINDPDKLDQRIKFLSAYADAIRTFIDRSRDTGQRELPQEVAEGFLARLKPIEWLKYSERAEKLANSLARILEAIVKFGGS